MARAAAALPELEGYPFAPHLLETAAGALHYLDEGPAQAEPLLCVHGNPTWSYFYRRLVSGLSDEYRVVAPDHIGCGRSDKPQDWSYRLADHVANLERLVLALDLSRVTLVVHDWGGPIGFGVAARHPERFARLVIFNTAAFPSGRIPLRIDLCRTPLLGQVLIRRFNAFARAATHMTVARPGRMTAAVRRGYLAPYDSWKNRIANWKFVADIPLSRRHPSRAALEEIAAALPRFADLPAVVIWGERDWCFTPEFRREWERRLPGAKVHAIPDAGHYLLEDAHEEILPWLKAFLREHPLS